jgi:uncharacterized damage-inducible protein DinB
MNTDESQTLRKQLVEAMSGRESHIDFASALKDFPEPSRGIKPRGAPHTAWQLLEHMRLAQRDILDFSHEEGAHYQAKKWPEDYWPREEAPPNATAWDGSIAGFQKDAQQLDRLVEDLRRDPFKPFSHGEGQTLVREALLVATHNSYHLGQLVFLKKTLLDTDVL